MTGNGLRHGTGNECEDRWLRFYQKGGDGEVDSNPIAMLSKGGIPAGTWPRREAQSSGYLSRHHHHGSTHSRTLGSVDFAHGRRRDRYLPGD